MAISPAVLPHQQILITAARVGPAHRLGFAQRLAGHRGLLFHPHTFDITDGLCTHPDPGRCRWPRLAPSRLYLTGHLPSPLEQSLPDRPWASPRAGPAW